MAATHATKPVRGPSKTQRKDDAKEEVKHDVSALTGNESGTQITNDYEDDDQGKKDPVPNEAVFASSDLDDVVSDGEDDGVGRQSDLSPLRDAEHDIQKHVRV